MWYNNVNIRAKGDYYDTPGIPDIRRRKTGDSGGLSGEESHNGTHGFS
jgi:hypothetical protein